MGIRAVATVALATALLVGCGEASGPEKAPDRSGVITGRVRLGPQCPVETEEHPCPDLPAAGARVTVAEPPAGDSTDPGKVVARTTTDADGFYRVSVVPGTYVVTADAGRSCDPEDVRVTADDRVRADIGCDTGIR